MNVEYLSALQTFTSYGRILLVQFFTVDCAQWEKHTSVALTISSGAHDSNLTMNILIILLEKFNDRFGLPPVLNLQLDNCWRENKNKFVFTFLALLVEWSVFDKVRTYTLNMQECFLNIFF